MATSRLADEREDKGMTPMWVSVGLVRVAFTSHELGGLTENDFVRPPG